MSSSICSSSASSPGIYCRCCASARCGRHSEKPRVLRHARCRWVTRSCEAMTMEHVLPIVWYLIIGFAVLMYVLLDGFVLGIGILTPFADNDAQRDHMMNTAAPIWDGNETWLVMGGAGLMAAFPKAYAIVLSALYLPILCLLIALIFRGVAFEFRFKARRSRWVWGVAFNVGSTIATFMQGLILGAVVEGMPL